jgi:hypothetical protein
MCDVTMPSETTPGHVHTCSAEPCGRAVHICADPSCRRWYGVNVTGTKGVAS